MDQLDDLDDHGVLPFAAAVAYRDEIGPAVGETPFIPRQVPWPDSWVRLIKAVRGLKRPSALEVFSGMTVLTDAFRDSGIECAPPVDAASDPSYNLVNAIVLSVAPPCASYSTILNISGSTRSRSLEFPGGIDGLSPKQEAQVITRNALAELAAIL